MLHLFQILILIILKKIIKNILFGNLPINAAKIIYFRQPFSLLPYIYRTNNTLFTNNFITKVIPGLVITMLKYNYYKPMLVNITFKCLSRYLPSRSDIFLLRISMNTYMNKTCQNN